MLEQHRGREGAKALYPPNEDLFAIKKYTYVYEIIVCYNYEYLINILGIIWRRILFAFRRNSNS